MEECGIWGADCDGVISCAGFCTSLLGTRLLLSLIFYYAIIIIIIIIIIIAKCRTSV
jgi:hypothetical protein